jgi:hypothetical protein
MLDQLYPRTLFISNALSFCSILGWYNTVTFKQFPQQNSVCFCLTLYCPNNCKWPVQATKFLILQYPELSIYFTVLSWKYRLLINYRSILQNLMTDVSSVTKLFIPPSDRRLRRTTTFKLLSERALNRHKFQDTPTTLGRWGSHFPPTLVYAFPAR